MPKNISQAVREVCLWLPESREVTSHGMADFRVGKRTFATYAVNHHGDGRIALWLNAPAGAQELYTRAEPKHFFVPPYVGPRGWLGIHLDKGISWNRVAKLAREAYEKVAPAKLSRQIGETIKIDPPAITLAPADFDPMQSKRAQAMLKALRKIVLAWPETTEARQFGHPVWRVGKKVFVSAHYYSQKLRLSFWVGVERQSLFADDERFEISPYTGHNGWISLDVTRKMNAGEVHELALCSYRHFALRRTLRLLDE